MSKKSKKYLLHVKPKSYKQDVLKSGGLFTVKRRLVLHSKSGRLEFATRNFNI